jgi:hypothetical protein
MNYPTAHWVHVLNHYSLDQNTYYLYIKNIMIHVYVYYSTVVPAPRHLLYLSSSHTVHTEIYLCVAYTLHWPPV